MEYGQTSAKAGAKVIEPTAGPVAPAGSVESLRRSDEQFKRLVQGVTDYAIYMLDPSGRVSTWNAGAQRIKGYAPEEIIGENYSRFYTEEDRLAGLPQQNLVGAARDGRFENEGWRVRKDGSRFLANVVIDAIRDERGTLIGFAKVTRDITERRLAQEALERTQHALFQTQKLQSLGQLTGGVAHDFNNLLSVIVSSLELLRKRVPEEDRTRRLLHNALQAAERGTVLTQRMLAFARRQELELEAIDVSALVRGMLELIERSIGPDVTIETRFPSRLPRVRSDANLLESALLNLAVNSRDAMPHGGTIAISAREAAADEAAAPPSLPPGSYVCLAVTDSGIGMDEPTLARAAEPFFTTKGIGKGTGLGLSMVEGLAEQSGGRLRVSSRPGAGTTVELWLPATAADREPRATGPEAREVPQRMLRQLVVLAVDDDELVLTSTAAMLDDLGHDVIAASSGRRALDVIETGARVDVVLTDQAMPGMTGLQLAQAIRETRPGLPIILATGYAEWKGGGFPDLRRLSKPYRCSDLEDALAAAVGDS